MSALREFASFTNLNVANLAASFDQLLVENSASYGSLPTDSRTAWARRLIKTVAEACEAENPQLLNRFLSARAPFLSNELDERQIPPLLAQIECLGQTLTPVVTNLEAGKFLWHMLAEARIAAFRSALNSPSVIELAQQTPTSLGSRQARVESEQPKQPQPRVDYYNRHIQINLEIAQQLANVPGWTDFYRRAVTLVQEQVGYDHIQLYTLAEQGLIFQDGTGEVGRRLKETGHVVPLHAEDNLMVQAVWSGEPVLAPDVSQELNALPHPWLQIAKAALAVPMVLGAEVVGVLAVQSETLGGLSQEDQPLLKGIAGQIALAIDSRRTYLAEQEARRQYQQILDGIVDIVLVKGSKSRIIWANKAFCNFYNLTQAQLQEIIDTPVTEPDYTKQAIKDDEYVFTTGQTLDIPQEAIKRYDGEVRLFHTVKSALRDAHGAVVMTVGVSRDITERQQAEGAHEELIAQAERRARREQTIREITEKMRAAVSLQELAQTTARELGQRLSAGHAVVELGIEPQPAHLAAPFSDSSN